jgi:hypothetical protein
MVTIDDLKFTKQSHGGIGTAFKTRSKVTISIQAGEYVYSTPRSNEYNPDEYILFEVALINYKGDFITDKFINCGEDKVAGWVSRSVINNIIYQLER